MRKPNRILVPTDFTKCSDHALNQAVSIARNSGATIDLLHVTTQLEGDSYSPLKLSPEAHARHDTADQAVYRLLQQAIARHEAADVNIKPVKQRSTSVVSRIARYAEKEKCDLIVIGKRHLKGIRRFISGHTAAEVVRRAPCDVLIIPEVWMVEGTPGSGPILVPVDFSEHSRAALVDARRLAEEHGGSIDLLHVVSTPSLFAPFSGVATINDLIPDLKEHALSWLKKFARETDAPDVPHRIFVEEGHAASRITAFAEHSRPDMIVMARFGLAGAGSLILGSVAERVARGSDIPVWSVHTEMAEPLPDEAVDEALDQNR